MSKQLNNTSGGGLLGVVVGLAIAAVLVIPALIIFSASQPENSSTNTTVLLKEQDLYDPQDFPGNTFTQVDWCFNLGEEYLLTWVPQESDTFECRLPGAVFFTSKHSPTMQCYRQGDSDWDVSNCNPSPYVYTLDKAMEACSRRYVINVINANRAYCLQGNENARDVIAPGDLADCYDKSLPPPWKMDSCPGFSYQVEYPYYDDTEPPGSLPSDVPVCSKDIVAYDALSGEAYCLGIDEPLPPEVLGRDSFDISCFDIKSLEMTNCPDSLIPGLTDESIVSEPV